MIILDVEDVDAQFRQVIAAGVIVALPAGINSATHRG
jgi:hypothetical protein